MISIYHYRLGKTNQDTRYEIDQNQAALVNGSSRQIRKFNLWNGFGVDMALLELYLFLYKFGLF